LLANAPLVEKLAAIERRQDESQLAIVSKFAALQPPVCPAVSEVPRKSKRR